MCASVDIDEPVTYEEAVTSPNANEWMTVMKEEMSSMAKPKNNIWELVDFPTKRKTIGNKWVLKVKRKVDGSIDKFKARLVAKEIVVHIDLELFQMDIKTTFLNGGLDERSIWINLKVFRRWEKAQSSIKRILRYLKGTSDLAFCYHGGSLRLVGYSYTDGSADKDERKSTSGYAFLLGGAAITWCSKKQPCISLSTMETKYIACTSTVQEAIWLRRFLKSLCIFAHVDDAVVIYCDNTTTIAYAKDPKYHGRTKHIDTRYHFIHDSIVQGEEIFINKEYVILNFVSVLCLFQMYEMSVGPDWPFHTGNHPGVVIASGMRLKRSFGINETCD
ncbi:Retrovirus-related Pol polyprotein from transposon TNT 1-94 [Sesamum angolense]|uniref:Retrovirus-related Pol polyprotein from transposon TNT 1-94 n=1 Tax=Sesamum angolense TaxID=2727404 RepID=A0AAE1W0F5_9LAMI|nr:Retrovirus-related Pol polyprotein from transposon TNT 1-94 [Sesamum angolense]